MIRLIYHFKIISLPCLFKKFFSITEVASHLQQPPPLYLANLRGRGKWGGGGGIYYSDLIHNTVEEEQAGSLPGFLFPARKKQTEKLKKMSKLSKHDSIETDSVVDDGKLSRIL